MMWRSFNTAGFAGLDASKLAVSDTGGKLVLSYQAVPEPSTWALLGFGALLLTTLRRKTCKGTGIF